MVDYQKYVKHLLKNEEIISIRAILTLMAETFTLWVIKTALRHNQKLQTECVEPKSSA